MVFRIDFLVFRFVFLFGFFQAKPERTNQTVNPVNGEEHSIIEQAQTIVLQQFKRDIVDPVAAFCGRYPRAENLKVNHRRKRFIPQALQILGTIGLSAGTASYLNREYMNQQVRESLEKFNKDISLKHQEMMQKIDERALKRIENERYLNRMFSDYLEKYRVVQVVFSSFPGELDGQPILNILSLFGITPDKNYAPRIRVQTCDYDRVNGVSLKLNLSISIGRKDQTVFTAVPMKIGRQCAFEYLGPTAKIESEDSTVCYAKEVRYKQSDLLIYQPDCLKSPRFDFLEDCSLQGNSNRVVSTQNGTIVSCQGQLLIDGRTIECRVILSVFMERLQLQ